LAKEAGYNGEKITLMTSQAYKHHYDSCVVMTKQMKDAGFNIDMQVYDWATLISKRGDPKQWDLFFTHHGFVPDPALLSFMNDSYAGWWVTDKKKALAEELGKTIDEKARAAVWGKIQALVYEEVPVIKTGDIFSYDIASPKVIGFGKTQLIWPRLWDASFSK
jgi:peptide/nickel transport system substrate-binding protein